MIKGKLHSLIRKNMRNCEIKQEGQCLYPNVPNGIFFWKRVSFTPFSACEDILPSLGDKLHISRVTRVPPFQWEYIVSHLKRTQSKVAQPLALKAFKWKKAYSNKI